MKKLLLTLCYVVVMCGISQVYAEKTYLYKRVMVVKDGTKSVRNDDAHYITFTNKGCYDSNKNGIATTGLFINFAKDENNLHCFYGKSYWGNAHYYFSDNYSRLNIKTAKGITHVYQREMNGKTSAKWRKQKNNGAGSVLITPVQGGGGGIDDAPTEGNGKMNNPSASRYTRCKYCGGGGGCSSCNGTGHKYNIYSGHEDSCPSCRGSGRCQICRGTGRL